LEYAKPSNFVAHGSQHNDTMATVEVKA